MKTRPFHRIVGPLLAAALVSLAGGSPSGTSAGPLANECHAARFRRGADCRPPRRCRCCPAKAAAYDAAAALCAAASPSQAAPAPNGLTAQSAWQPLFDGETLDGWKSTRFGGEGEVHAGDGQIVLDFGYSLTGITLTREFPKTNYEISLEAKRTQGIDFFCGLTFPVDDSYCSFIVAGWAGAVVGLSSIDGRDASENETTRYMSFDNDRWYRIRVRVRPEKIMAWIDDELVVDQPITGRRISTRNEVDLTRPLGISAYESTAVLRDIKYRLLSEDDESAR